MAISAKFLADFSDFDRGSKEASKNVLSFQQAVDRAGGRLADFGRTANSDAAPKVGTLSDSLRTFDGILASAGIHIAPAVKALGELGAAASTSAAALGTLGTAGIVVGFGVLVYKIAGAAFELAGLSEALKNNAYFQTQNVEASQRLAEHFTILAKASATARREITDITEAIRINATEAEHLALVRGRSADAAHDSFVQEAALQKELREARARGDIPALTHDIDLHILSQKELSTKYGLTTQAIGYFIDKLKATEAASKEAQRAQEELAKGWAQFYDWAADQEAARQAQLKAGFDAWRNEAKAIEANAGVLDTLLRKAAYDVALAEDEARDKTAGLTAALQNVPAVAEPAATGLLSLGSAAMSAAGGFFAMSAELYNAIRAAQAAESAFNKDRFLQTGLSGFIGYAPRATGGPVTAGGSYLVGERGPELFRPNASGTILPAGAGAVAITNVFNIVDTESNIARRVSDHLTRSIMTARKLS